MTGSARKKKGEFNRASAPLQTFRVQNFDAHAVDIDNAASRRLMVKAYTEIYEPAFPLDDERESMSAWLNTLSGNNPDSTMTLIIIGENLETETPVLKGISAAYYYNKFDVGILAYNAISPAFRGGGIGRAMVTARIKSLLDCAKSKGGALRGVFLECHDPQKIAPDKDSFDPATRLKIFQSWGAQIMPIDYTPPVMAKGLQKNDTLLLLAYPHPETGAYPVPDAIRRFVTGIYTTTIKYTGNLPHEDADYLHMMRQLDTLQVKTPKPPGLV